MVNLMVKKFLLLIFLLIILVVVLSWDKFINQSNSYELSGQIIEVRDNSIIVEGVAKSSDPNINRQENRTIEIKITNETIIKKNVVVITTAQINSGESFQPETQVREGVISELVIGIRVIKIESRDNLFTKDKAVAAEINYLIYEFPASPIQ